MGEAWDLYVSEERWASSNIKEITLLDQIRPAAAEGPVTYERVRDIQIELPVGRNRENI